MIGQQTINLLSENQKLKINNQYFCWDDHDSQAVLRDFNKKYWWMIEYKF